MSTSAKRVYYYKVGYETRKKNVVELCKLGVKSILSKAALGSIDDSSTELQNFCVAVEQMLTLGLKGVKPWAMHDTSITFWNYIRDACKGIPQNCIASISQMSNPKTPKGKVRAWIRMALMEKRLSEYLATAVQNNYLTRLHYHDDAIILTEDGTVLIGYFNSLKTVDFTLFLKNTDLDLQNTLEINYIPYLTFKENSNSGASNDYERVTLSAQVTTVSESEGKKQSDVIEKQLKAKLDDLEKKYLRMSEQKNYLEEILRQKDSKIKEAVSQQVRLMDRLTTIEKKATEEKREMEELIDELQEELNYYKNLTGNNVSRQSIPQQISGEYHADVYNPQPQQPPYTQDYRIPPTEELQDYNQNDNYSEDSFQMNQHNYSSKESLNELDHNQLDNQVSTNNPPNETETHHITDDVTASTNNPPNETETHHVTDDVIVSTNNPPSETETHHVTDDTPEKESNRNDNESEHNA
ncbi:RUN domain-containing protein 3B [Trichoplax sp. H2]|nr:RUN domain-containing protein 3B [Trichoplax sp. H2]|eukprot:RDD40776.1 RUN domain-containing protein 3B [Trichoplax sp. H2]